MEIVDEQLGYVFNDGSRFSFTKILSNVVDFVIVNKIKLGIAAGFFFVTSSAVILGLIPLYLTGRKKI